MKVWALILILWDANYTNVLAHFDTRIACEAAVVQLNSAWNNKNLSKNSFCVEVIVLPPQK